MVSYSSSALRSLSRASRSTWSSDADRRDLVWINVTTHPTADWIARQITEAFPWAEAPRYVIRDRDCVYGAAVTHRLPFERAEMPANCGLFVRDRETSVRIGLRGTRTSNQTVM